MSNEGDMRDFDSFKVPAHERLWGSPIDQSEIDKVKQSPARTNSAVKAKAYRVGRRLIENDEHKSSFTHNGTTYIVLKTHTVSRTDSDSKTTPTEPGHKSSELKNYISLPGYYTPADERNMFNLMTPLIEDFQYFEKWERKYHIGNVYISVATELPSYSRSEWSDGGSSKNVYILNIFHKCEVMEAVKDRNTKTLTEMGVHERDSQTEKNEEPAQVEINLDALEEGDDNSVPNGVDNTSIQSVADWAKANHTTPEVVDLLEYELGIELDRNADGTLNKKGMCTVFAATVKSNRENGE